MPGSAKVMADGEHQRPYWITRKRVEEIQGECAKFGGDAQECMQHLRHHNQKLQLSTPSWKRIQSVIRETSPDEKTKVIDEIIHALENSAQGGDMDGDDVSAGDILYRPGPVGDLPLHQAFLLGESELGKRLVKTFYCRPGIDGEQIRHPSDHSPTFIPHPSGGINTPYVSDLQVWKGLVPDVFDDGGLYTGETVLHIAIVREDLELLDWMLAQGACITARAKGAFFKPSLTFTEHSLQSVNLAAHGHGNGMQSFTNHDSMCDYGEFPFSFAASVGNVEVLARLARHAEGGGIRKDELIEVLKTQRKIRASLNIHDEIVVSEKGGFMKLLVGLQDSRGNTALHMAVLYDQKESVDWIMARQGQESLHMLNADGMTPFTLAAHEGNLSMLHHILEKHMKTVVWRYGSTQLVRFSLLQLDSFRTNSALHQHPKWKSALEIIIENDMAAFARDPRVAALLKEKWSKFAKRHYERQFLMPYIAYLLIYWATMVCRWQELDAEDAQVVSFAASLTGSIAVPNNAAGAPDFMQTSVNWLSFVSLILHTILLIVWVPWLILSAYRDRHYRQPGESLQGAIFKNLTLILCSLMVVCCLLVSAARAGALPEMEKNVWAVGSILASLQLLVFIIPFQFFGTIVISLYKMLVNDLAIFVFIYAILHLAFSLAMSLSFVKSPAGIMPIHAEFATRFPGMMLYQFWTGMDNLAMEELEPFARWFPATQTLHLTFVVLFNVLGLNLIIAMMGKTFTTGMEDVHRLWFFPFATLVLHLERNLTDVQRRNCAAYRCGMDPGGPNSSAPELQEHDEDLGEHGPAPRSSCLPYGAQRQRAPDDVLNSCAWQREFFLEQQQEIASDNGADKGATENMRTVKGPCGSPERSGELQDRVMDGLLKWVQGDMMRELKHSQELFCKDVDRRLEAALAAHHLAPVLPRAASGARPSPSASIDTTHVVASVVGSAGQGAAPTGGSGGGEDKAPMVKSGRGTPGAEPAARAPGAAQLDGGYGIPGATARSLRGISPLPASRQASATPSRDPSLRNVAARPPSAANSVSQRVEAARPIESAATAHAENGQHMAEPHPFAPMPYKGPRVPAEQQQKGGVAQAHVRAPLPRAQEQQQRLQYAQAMEMLSLSELGIEDIDRDAGNEGRVKASGNTTLPPSVASSRVISSAQPGLEAGLHKGAARSPRDREGARAATPPQSEGRVSSTASAAIAFKPAPAAPVDTSRLSPELAMGNNEGCHSDVGNSNVNNQSVMSTASSASQRSPPRQQSPPRPTTRLVPYQPQPQRMTGTSPRKRVPETKALVVDAQQQQAMRAGFALAAGGAQITMVPDTDAAGAMAQPTTHSTLPAAPAVSASAPQPVAAGWNAAGELMAAPVQLAAAPSMQQHSQSPRTVPLRVYAGPSGAQQEAETHADVPGGATSRASTFHAAGHPGAIAAQLPAAAPEPAESTALTPRATSSAEAVLDPTQGEAQGGGAAAGAAEGVLGPRTAQGSEAVPVVGKGRAGRPILKPLSQAKQPAPQEVPEHVRESPRAASASAAGSASAPADRGGGGGSVSASKRTRITRIKETRPGMKKIYVQQVVEGGVMEVEEWVPCDDAPVAQMFQEVLDGADALVHGGNFGSSGKGSSDCNDVEADVQLVSAAAAQAAGAGWGPRGSGAKGAPAGNQLNLKRLPPEERGGKAGLRGGESLD